MGILSVESQFREEIKAKIKTKSEEFSLKLVVTKFKIQICIAAELEKLCAAARRDEGVKK